VLGDVYMTYKCLVKRKYNKEKTTSKDRNLILKGITGLLWILFILYLVWIIVSFAWILLYKYFDNNLYVPTSISFLLSTFSHIFIWIISVSIGFFIIYKYRKIKKNNKKDTKLNTFNDYNIEVIENKLMGLDPKNKDEYILIKEILQNQGFNQISPSKMLSCAIILYNKGLVKESMSILRLVIEHQDSSPLIVEVAKYRLMQILTNFD